MKIQSMRRAFAPSFLTLDTCPAGICGGTRSSGSTTENPLRAQHYPEAGSTVLSVVEPNPKALARGKPTCDYFQVVRSRLPWRNLTLPISEPARHSPPDVPLHFDFERFMLGECLTRRKRPPNAPSLPSLLRKRYTSPSS